MILKRNKFKLTERKRSARRTLRIMSKRQAFLILTSEWLLLALRSSRLFRRLTFQSQDSNDFMLFISLILSRRNSYSLSSRTRTLWFMVISLILNKDICLDYLRIFMPKENSSIFCRILRMKKSAPILKKLLILPKTKSTIYFKIKTKPKLR